MQIDWMSAIVETPPDMAPGYLSGQSWRIGPDGDVQSKKPVPLDVQDSEPSSSRAFRVWTPQPHSLYLSGNPVKLLQQHNLFGSCDVPGLYLEAGQWIRGQVGLFPSPETWDSCEFGLPKFTRLDITRSYRFPSVAAAQSYIRDVAGAARSRHGAARLYGSETAIFGEGSRRWSFKVYDKFSELWHQSKKRRGVLRRVADPVDPELLEWASGVVRFELTLRYPELEDRQHLFRLPAGGTWSRKDWSWPRMALELWQGYHQRITWNENATMTTENDLMESTLNGGQKAALMLWRSGKDLRAVYSQNTFYRHRRALLSLVGVDIASPPAPAKVAQASAVLDPAGWDPEPIKSRLVEPRADLKTAYKLV